MAIICPTVTDTLADPHEYRRQIESLSPFAKRVHIDLMDGTFAPSRSINPIQVWWPETTKADIHLMYQRPLDHIETLVSLSPNMVIIHAEAEGNLSGMISHLQRFQIRTGVALLKTTTVESAAKLIALADHVLLFSGDLGHFGGVADLEVLNKINDIKAIKPGTEIGWDGGASLENVKQLAESGVDIINVGGAIQRAGSPSAAYKKLELAII